MPTHTTRTAQTANCILRRVNPGIYHGLTPLPNRIWQSLDSPAMRPVQLGISIWGMLLTCSTFGELRGRAVLRCF